jgi:hypothetical protein
LRSSDWTRTASRLRRSSSSRTAIKGASFLRQLVVVKHRLLAAFVGYDERFHLDQTLYLAWIRP